MFVCVNRRPDGDPRASCAVRGGEEVREAFRREVAARGLQTRVRVNAAGCLGECRRGITVVVYPEQVWYGGVEIGDVAEIVADHLVGGVPVARLRLMDKA